MKIVDKPREFWLNEDAGYDDIEIFTDPIDGCIHVIEYSAYEELKNENRVLLKVMAEEVVGEISRSMADSFTSEMKVELLKIMAEDSVRKKTNEDS